MCKAMRKTCSGMDGVKRGRKTAHLFSSINIGPAVKNDDVNVGNVCVCVCVCVCFGIDRFMNLIYISTITHCSLFQISNIHCQ